jgi:hypothetical protein
VVVDCEVSKGALVEVTPGSTISVSSGVRVFAGKARLAEFPSRTDEALVVVSMAGIVGTNESEGVPMVPVV